MTKKNKSDSYQFRICEISIDPSVLNEFPFSDGLGSQLSLAQYNEEFDELKEKLLFEVLRLINNDLTERQKQVVLKRLEGKTQIQIAEELQIHQTSIHKILSGNIDFSNGKKRYGGAYKKLKKLCAKDNIIQDILTKMRELRGVD